MVFLVTGIGLEMFTVYQVFHRRCRRVLEARFFLGTLDASAVYKQLVFVVAFIYIIGF